MSVWKPVLLRALVCLVFGAVTVFWAKPSEAGTGVAVGLYFLATAAAQVMLLRQLRFPKTNKSFIALALPAGIMTAYGLSFLINSRVEFIAFNAAAALFLLGLGEAYLGIRYRRRHLLAQDWLTAGVVGIGTAAVVPFFTALGPHALLGVVGGGAIITGALLLLAALTIRFDAAKPAQAVN